MRGARRLDDDELELLEGLLREATEAPWRFVEDDGSGKWRIVGPEGERLFEEPATDSEDESYAAFQGSQADYRLVAAARVALPRLLAELRRLRGLVRKARDLQAALASEGEGDDPATTEDDG